MFDWDEILGAEPENDDDNMLADGIDDDDDGVTVYDTDGDGIPETEQHVYDLDTDGDGIADAKGVQTLYDDDEDGIFETMVIETDLDLDGEADAAHVEYDMDGDGVRDTLEYTRLYDTDGDGEIDLAAMDTDTDMDGNVDISQYFHLDENGNVTSVDTAENVDMDGDGAVDTIVTSIDYDNDGVANHAYAVSDTDGDGVGDTSLSMYELDTDGDGRVDTIVNETDFGMDGQVDFAGAAKDTDGDGVIDSYTEYQAIDSDGDGRADGFHVASDLDGDGAVDEEYIMDTDGNIVDTDLPEDTLEDDEVEEPQNIENPENPIEEPEDEWGNDPTDAEEYIINAERFDSDNYDDDDIIGNPEESMDAYHEQETPTSCAVCAQEFVLEQLTDREFTEEELRELAEENGWYEPGGGTLPHNMAKILEDFGVECTMDYDNTIEDIERCLENDGAVIVAVDIFEVYHTDIPGEGANHAVQVIGIDKSDPENPMVILNDSGVPDGGGIMVPLDDFMNAWADSDCQMVEAYGD